MADDRTLTEILASLGYTHRPSQFQGQRDVIDASGRLVITGTAQGVTTWLRERGMIASVADTPAARLPSGGYDYQGVKLELRRAGRLVDDGFIATADSVIRNLAGSATPNDISNALTRAQLAKLRKYSKAAAFEGKAMFGGKVVQPRGPWKSKTIDGTKVRFRRVSGSWPLITQEPIPGGINVEYKRGGKGPWVAVRSTSTRGEARRILEGKKATPKKKAKTVSKKATKKKASKRKPSKKINILGLSPNHDGDWRTTIQRTRLYASQHIDAGNLKKTGGLMHDWSNHERLIAAIEAIKPKRKPKKRKPLEGGEARLLKAPGDLIAMYAGKYKLTDAMEAVRRASRTGAAIKCRTVITAYDQLKRRAKAPGKSPGQSLAYYVTAELAKALAHSPYFVATGKGDHPRIKPE